MSNTLRDSSTKTRQERVHHGIRMFSFFLASFYLFVMPNFVSKLCVLSRPLFKVFHELLTERGVCIGVACAFLRVQLPRTAELCQRHLCLLFIFFSCFLLSGFLLLRMRRNFWNCMRCSRLSREGIVINIQFKLRTGLTPSLVTKGPHWNGPAVRSMKKVLPLVTQLSTTQAAEISSPSRTSNRYSLSISVPLSTI